MNFGTLKARVAGYLNRDDLTSQIPDFITIAQRKIERGDPIEAAGLVINPAGNYNCMRTEATGTLTSASPYLAFPTRYKDIINFWVIDDNNQYSLVKDSKAHAIELYKDLTGAAGTIDRPKIFSTDWVNSRFILRPTPDTTYTYYLEYYNYLAELSLDADTNWWTSNCWEILLYGALLQAEPYLVNDARAIVWAGMLKNALDGLAIAENREIFNGSPQSIKGNLPV